MDKELNFDSLLQRFSRKLTLTISITGLEYRGEGLIEPKMDSKMRRSGRSILDLDLTFT